jgi:hypothetical protein
MLALDFVLSTISHLIAGDDGPSPGIPAHAGAGFEQELLKLCEGQRISAVISHSLDRLVLPPGLSRLALERLKDSEKQIAANSRRLHRKWSLVASLLEERGLPCLLAGELGAADRLYPAEVARPLHRLELLARETDWPGLAACLGDAGFELTVPRAGRLAPGEALRFFQLFTPCRFLDPDGDELRLNFRLFYFGRPDAGEAAWDRSVPVPPGSACARAMSREDQLIAALLDFSLGGQNELLLVMDIGLLIGRFGDEMDWPYVQSAVTRRGLHRELYLSLKRVEDLLGFGFTGTRLSSPGRLRENLFDFIWGGGRAERLLSGRAGRRETDFRRLGSRRFREWTALLGDVLNPPPALWSCFSPAQPNGRSRLEFIWRALFSKWTESEPAGPIPKRGGGIIDRKQGW